MGRDELREGGGGLDRRERSFQKKSQISSPGYMCHKMGIKINLLLKYTHTLTNNIIHKNRKKIVLSKKKHPHSTTKILAAERVF